MELALILLFILFVPLGVADMVKDLRQAKKEKRNTRYAQIGRGRKIVQYPDEKSLHKEYPAA